MANVNKAWRFPRGPMEETGGGGQERERGRDTCTRLCRDAERKSEREGSELQNFFAELISLMRPDHLTSDFSFFLVPCFPLPDPRACNCSDAPGGIETFRERFLFHRTGFVSPAREDAAGGTSIRLARVSAKRSFGTLKCAQTAHILDIVETINYFAIDTDAPISRLTETNRFSHRENSTDSLLIQFDSNLVAI